MLGRVAIALTALLLAVLASHLSHPPTPVPLSAPSTMSCKDQRGRVFSGKRTPGGATFLTNGTLWVPLCSASTIHIRARGTVAAGHGADLVVSIGGERLWDGELTGSKALDFNTRRTGWLGVGFVNDLMTAHGDRNLIIENLVVSRASTGSQPK